MSNITERPKFQAFIPIDGSGPATSRQWEVVVSAPAATAPYTLTFEPRLIGRAFDLASLPATPCAPGKVDAIVAPAVNYHLS